jgi:membrane fusion protein, multidrug efflux system
MRAIFSPAISTLLRRLARFVLLGFVPLIAVIVGLHWYARGGRDTETENAYVKAHIMAISAEVSGRIAELGVRDNDPVEKGALLFRVDTTPFEIAAAKAKAQMDVVRTEVKSLRAEYRAALVEREEAKERISFLSKQLDRQARLKEYGMIRADLFDEAQLNLQVARRRLASVEEQANRVLANLAGNPNFPEEQHPRFLEAKTALDAAEMELKRTRVVAPAAGVVSNMKLRVGEHVERGQPIFSLIEGGPVWVEANFKETQLTHMRVGQRAQVVADAYPDRPWTAAVSAIAPATGAEFAVLPPQNATGNWVKVVQRVPVLLQVEQAPGQPPLRAGMTVTVSVNTGHERGLPKPVQRLVDAGWLPRFLQPSPALAREGQ